MIFKNMAEYEDKDSELAKFTISQLHCKIQELKSRNKELAMLNINYINETIELRDRINKAIEYIKEKARNNCWIDQYEANDLIKILKGVDKE